MILSKNNFMDTEEITEVGKELKECKYCGQGVKTHLRCRNCEILLHDMVYKCECGVAHTLTFDNIHCIRCGLEVIPLEPIITESIITL